ncbi:MAG: DMT family transporter [Alphaproteobacteria bacterium]|nr:DMT family transporter [Alphaproteobacteria bacterium]
MTPPRGHPRPGNPKPGYPKPGNSKPGNPRSGPPLRGQVHSAAATTKGILLTLLGCFLIVVGDSITKSLGSHYTPGQMIFLRGAFATPMIVIAAYRWGGIENLKIRALKAQTFRALTVCVSAFLFVNGLVRLPLADALAITFFGPIMTTLLAVLFLDEKVGWRRWTAIGVGFAGVIVMLQPSSDGIQAAALFPLGACIAGAVRDILTRKLTSLDSSMAILAYTNMVVTIAAAFTWLIEDWAPIRSEDLWFFAIMGVLSVLIQWTLIEGLRLAEAGIVSPFKYSMLVWGIIVGWLVFGEIPTAAVMVGGVLVIGSGLYIWFRETRQLGKPGEVKPKHPST